MTEQSRKLSLKQLAVTKKKCSKKNKYNKLHSKLLKSDRYEYVQNSFYLQWCILI